jgi:hypothetical protein
VSPELVALSRAIRHFQPEFLVRQPALLVGGKRRLTQKTFDHMTHIDRLPFHI